MLKNLFRRKAVDVPARIDKLTYAVGDVHGRRDLLELLVAKVRDDARSMPDRPRLVFLGDYVDRGADSAGVLDFLCEMKRADWCDVVLLKGNHEESMLQFLKSSTIGPIWSDHGGDATLASYGVSRPVLKTSKEEWEDTRRAFVDAVPSRHVDLLETLNLHFTAGDYLFVHAGVKPGLPLEEQTARELLWIRNEFLASPKASNLVVVHGHTADAEVANQRWRIGIDTGAYATGVLSAVKLVETDRDFIQVR